MKPAQVVWERVFYIFFYTYPLPLSPSLQTFSFFTHLEVACTYYFLPLLRVVCRWQLFTGITSRLLNFLVKSSCIYIGVLKLKFRASSGGLYYHLLGWIPVFFVLVFFFGGTRWRAGGLFHLYGNRLHRKVEVYYVTWQHDVLYFTSFLQPLLVAARRIIFVRWLWVFSPSPFIFLHFLWWEINILRFFLQKGALEWSIPLFPAFAGFLSLDLIY